MDEREVRYQPDWPSRIVAIFSLLVSSLALGYVVMQGQTAVTRQGLERQFDQRLQDHLAQRQPEWNSLMGDLRKSAENERAAEADRIATFLAEQGKKIDDALQQSLADRQEQYTALVSSQNDRLEQLEDSVNRITVARPAVPPADTTAQAADPSSTASEAADTTEATGPTVTGTATEIDVQPTERDAELRIENLGETDVVIDSLRFVPSDYLAANRLVLGSPSAETGEWVFSTASNSSATSGEHGVYELRLTTPVTVRPRQPMTIRVSIDNPVHRGWALVGDLSLLSDGREVGSLRRIAAPFNQR